MCASPGPAWRTPPCSSCTLLISETSHVTKLWDDEGRATGTSPFLSQLWHRDEKRLLHISDFLIVASPVVLHVGHFLLIPSLKLVSGFLVLGDLVNTVDFVVVPGDDGAEQGFLNVGFEAS